MSTFGDAKTFWQLQSDRGMEGIFYTKREAEECADSLRGIGARGLKLSECGAHGKPLPTSRRLANALAEAGFADLATRAADDEFDDYRSPHPTPQIRLVEALRAISVVYDPRSPVEQFVARVVAGEFDGTKEEAAAWGRKFFARQGSGEQFDDEPEPRDPDYGAPSSQERLERDSFDADRGGKR